jgi:ferritin-like metal-binding protein YciE
MASASTLHDAFLDELRDLYNAEKQLTKALPKPPRLLTSPTPSKVIFRKRWSTSSVSNRASSCSARRHETRSARP